VNLVALPVAVLALGAAFGAAAQQVYRCGPDGSIYQQAPCAQGRAVDVGDPRTAEQREAAQAVAKKEAAAAAKFDRDAVPASAPKKGKNAKPAPAPKSHDGAASSAASGKKKGDAKSKPLVFLVPLPKHAASAAKP
jgi:hypothetical protein